MNFTTQLKPLLTTQAKYLNVFKQQIFLICILFLIVGCAQQPVHPKLSQENIAISYAKYPPEADFNVYALNKSSAASELGKDGAAGGALLGAVAPLYGGPIGILVYPYIAPWTILGGTIFGGITGAASGGIHGLSQEEVIKVHNLFDKAFHHSDAHEQLAKRVAHKATKAGFQVRIINDIGPSSVNEEVNYKEKSCACNSILELSINKVRIKGGMFEFGGPAPRTSLEMKLHVRIISMDNNSTPGITHFEWTGRSRELIDWKTGGERLIASDLEKCYEKLAQDVFENLFPVRPE